MPRAACAWARGQHGHLPVTHGLRTCPLHKEDDDGTLLEGHKETNGLKSQHDVSSAPRDSETLSCDKEKNTNRLHVIVARGHTHPLGWEMRGRGLPGGGPAQAAQDGRAARRSGRSPAELERAGRGVRTRRTRVPPAAAGLHMVARGSQQLCAPGC